MARQNLAPSLTLLFGDKGGYSNRATDSGGPMKFGITHRTLAAYRGAPSVTAQQVKVMVFQEAEENLSTFLLATVRRRFSSLCLDYAVFNSALCLVLPAL